MIYLFEDRRDRMLDYLGQELNNENINEAKFIVPIGQSIDEYIVNVFKDARTIIFHKSYRFPDSSITIEQVVDSFKKNIKTCQFVLFSGSIETGNYYLESNNQYFLNINSAIMYSNLEYFIHDYTFTGNVDVRKLLFAENVEKNEILSFFNIAMMVIHGYSEDCETISFYDIEDFIFARTIMDNELLIIKEKIIERYSESNQINKSELAKYINELVNEKL
jgi:hypothetical protein